MLCRGFVLLLLFTHLGVLHGQLEKEGVIDSIPIPDKDNEFYALYVPGTLDETKPFPALFVFDPDSKLITWDCCFTMPLSTQFTGQTINGQGIPPLSCPPLKLG